MTQDDTRVATPTALFPPPNITSGEFENFVAQELVGAASCEVNGLTVTIHEKITGGDGTYDFDATARFEFAGMSFLVLIEAKLHKNPIKRELVQVLYQKVQSVGAHKGVMVSTAPYQSGAVVYAKAHGIALVTVTEGRFIFEARGVSKKPVLSREEAAARFGVPPLVGRYFGPGSQPGSTAVRLLSPDNRDYPRHVAEVLLGVPYSR